MDLEATVKRLVTELEAIKNENKELREKVEHLEKNYSDLDKVTGDIMDMTKGISGTLSRMNN